MPHSQIPNPPVRFGYPAQGPCHRIGSANYRLSGIQSRSWCRVMLHAKAPCRHVPPTLPLQLKTLHDQPPYFRLRHNLK